MIPDKLVRELMKKVVHDISNNGGSAEPLLWSVTNKDEPDIIGFGLVIIMGQKVGYQLFGAERLPRSTSALYILSDENNVHIATRPVFISNYGEKSSCIILRTFSPSFHSHSRLAYHVKLKNFGGKL